MQLPEHGHTPAQLHTSYGGHSEGETPGPIPNPEAKPSSADGTAPARVWESRTPPNTTPQKRGPHPGAPFFWWSVCRIGVRRAVGHTAAVRISIRVRAGASRTRVGGEHDGALVVRVGARAADGQATEAALAAVTDAFGVRRCAVTLVIGAIRCAAQADFHLGGPDCGTGLG